MPCSHQKIELPLMDNVQTIPPPFVVRTLLIYSRHAGQLMFNPSEAISVRASPHPSTCHLDSCPPVTSQEKYFPTREKRGN